MFDFLSQKFSSIFSQLTTAKALTDENIKDVLEQVKDALLEADVPYDVVDAFIDTVKKDAVGTKIKASLKPSEQLLMLVHDKVVHFLGGEQKEPFAFQFPSVVMVMGLQGSGKTTTIGKLAYQIKNESL